jgi:N-acetylglutamate synthase-like GNAT family acetyltransferase
MLVAELDVELIGAGLAFRKDSSPGCRTATLRNVAVLPPYGGLGLERRLIQRIEDGAASLGVTRIILAGPSGAERQFFLGMGYRGGMRAGSWASSCRRCRGIATPHGLSAWKASAAAGSRG